MSDFVAQSATRKRRALKLAEAFPAASEILCFYSALTDFQTAIFPRTHKYNALCLLEEELLDFIENHAPAKLQEVAAKLDLSVFTQSISDYWQRRDTTSPKSFFARIILQPWASASEEVTPIALGENLCPRCGHLPQVAVLRTQGHGKAVSLVCSLCLHEWNFRRVCCAGCLEDKSDNIEFHVAEEYPHFQVQMCRSCNGYILIIDVEQTLEAIPFVDEIGVPTLDLWAMKNGFVKLQPNLAGV